MDEPKNIFIIGADDFNMAQLRRLRMASRYAYHELLTLEEIKGHEDYRFEAALKTARERLKRFDGRVDAIITFWDFPATLLLPILVAEFDLPGPDLESVLRCEHKYWSRLVQRECTNACPEFQTLDPFADDVTANVRLDYPFWIKPVKGTGSMLAFKIEKDAELEEALAEIRENVGKIAEPFDEALRMAKLPPEVENVLGRWCVLESVERGSQHTVSGYVHDGSIVTYGLVDSVHYPDRSSFARYEYPSGLSAAVGDRMFDISKRVIRETGLNESAFNIEYFYDEDADRIALLEINPRISQSHSDIYHKVDGDSNEEIVVQLALGEDPKFPHREGKYRYAAKCFYRTFEDGVVRRAPTSEDIDAIVRTFPDTIVESTPEPGTRLSDLAQQDSYSYVLATIHLGANSREEVVEKYEAVVDRLPFVIESPDGSTTGTKKGKGA